MLFFLRPLMCLGNGMKEKKKRRCLFQFSRFFPRKRQGKKGGENPWEKKRDFAASHSGSV